MKIFVTTSLLVFSSQLLPAQTALQKAELYYRQGLLAEKAAEPAKATASYQAALKLNPTHAKARYRIGQVQLEAGQNKLHIIEKQIGEVVIPVFNLEDSSLPEAMEALSQAIDLASEKKVTANFVIQDPDQKLSQARVNMQLKNVPVKAILNYIHQQTGSRSKYDEYSVKILPLK